MGYIYKIINTINNKIYVGKTVRTLKKRFEYHIKEAKNKPNRYLYDAMNHYGYENFKIELIEEVDNTILNEKEIYWISELKSQDNNIGYNLTKGGDGGCTGNYYYGKSPYDWWVEKYGKEKADSIKKKAIENSTKTIIEQRKGKSCVSEEQKLKISKTNKQKGIKPPVMKWNELGITPPRLGKKHKDESKEKIRKFRKGKTIEEIYKDVEKATLSRESSRKKWSNSNNPNFKYVDSHKILELLKMGKNRDEISKILGISKPTIISKFKETFGCNPSEYKMVD